MDFSMKLNDNKAGLQGLDKDRINAIIKEASKNSRYTKHQEKRAARIQERIRQQEHVISKLTPGQIRLSELEMDRLVKQFEESRDLSRTVVHIDMDAFYASVEMRDNPYLRDKPMAVGSISMLSTSNYIARRFGVRAAMAGYIGKKLCPHLTIVPCDFRKYTAASEQVRLILAEYDPNFLAIGLDEATLDITDYLRTRQSTCGGEEGQRKMHQRRRYAGNCLCKLPRYDESTDGTDWPTEHCEKCGNERVIIEDEVSFGHSSEEVTNELRFRIEQRTGLTASAGISVNKMLAKVCADINKPNGQYYLQPDCDVIMEFVRRLPIRKISGIGSVTESMLKAIGVETCKDLYDKRGLLALIHYPSSYRFFLRVALGVGSGFFESGSDGDSDRKSIGVERTFPETSDPEQLSETCRKLCEKAVEHMKNENLIAKTVTLKLKTVDFDVKTRATTLDNFVCDVDSIIDAANGNLLAEIAAAPSKKLRLRLMGIRLSSFLHETEANRRKLPEITQYLRQAKCNDTSSSSSPSKKLFSVDEDSVDSTCSGIATVEETANEEDEIIVLSDDDNEEAYAAPAAPGSSSATFSNDDIGEEKLADVEKAQDRPSVVCPVCNCKFPHSTWGLFNTHLDQCLNRKAVSRLVKEQDSELRIVLPLDGRGKVKAGKRKGESPKKASKRATGDSQSESWSMKRIDHYFRPR